MFGCFVLAGLTAVSGLALDWLSVVVPGVAVVVVVGVTTAGVTVLDGASFRPLRALLDP